MKLKTKKKTDGRKMMRMAMIEQRRDNVRTRISCAFNALLGAHSSASAARAQTRRPR